MKEAAFPVLGAAFVVLAVLPLSALAAKACLVALERRTTGGPLHDLNLRYLLLISSTALPVVWFVSAGIHQAESGLSALACLFEHGAPVECGESLYFALTLLALTVGLSLRTRRSGRAVRPSVSRAAVLLERRVERLLAQQSSLAMLRGRVRATAAPDFALGTDGLLRPRVLVGTEFARALSDEMLLSALAHECEHVRSFDPLRYLLLRVAVALSPLGPLLLGPHARRWQAAREAHCDREAVLRGAHPLPLADAIVRAARPGPAEVVALGARDASMLRFRVGMLLAFAERAPSRCCRRDPSALPLGMALLVAVLLLPHQGGTSALDALHVGTERLVSLVWH